MVSLALPVYCTLRAEMGWLTVVENFGAYYMEQKKREVISKKKHVNEQARRENDASKTVSDTLNYRNTPHSKFSVH